MENPTLTKQSLRTEIKKLLRHLPTEQRKDLSIKTCQRVIDSPVWQQAQNILLFASLPDEIDTTLLFELGMATHKNLFLPRVNGMNLEICQYTNDHLQKGAFGIMEPTENAQILTDYSSLDLIIVPGVAFTPQGARLGRGKSFYDRFLPLTKAYRMGIAYAFQMVDQIPLDPWDEQLNEVCWVD